MSDENKQGLIPQLRELGVTAIDLLSAGYDCQTEEFGVANLKDGYNRILDAFKSDSAIVLDFKPTGKRFDAFREDDGRQILKRKPAGPHDHEVFSFLPFAFVCVYPRACEALAKERYTGEIFLLQYDENSDPEHCAISRCVLTPLPPEE